MAKPAFAATPQRRYDDDAAVLPDDEDRFSTLFPYKNLYVPAKHAL